MADLDATRDVVARSCRILGKLELTKETRGHVSARVPGTDSVLIRARGPGEEGVQFTSAEEVIAVDLSGKKLDGRDDLQAPNETPIHTWMYRTRPDVQSVIHIHPATVVLLTICNKPLLPLYGAYDPAGLRLVVQGIPVYPQSHLISNDERGQALARVMGDKTVCLMRGHGITVVGPTVEDATVSAINLGELAEMNYRAYLLGDPEPISDEDIESFAHMLGGGALPGNRQPTTWRYYRRLLGE
jgi:ribulose-5-phosphate 4-epimerase/fuculose-1-phosphate aldolase